MWELLDLLFGVVNLCLRLSALSPSRTAGGGVPGQCYRLRRWEHAPPTPQALGPAECTRSRWIRGLDRRRGTTRGGGTELAGELRRQIAASLLSAACPTR